MLNRREVLQGTASLASAAVASTLIAGEGPFSGATAKFDKTKLDRLPDWAFTKELVPMLTPRPKFMGQFADVDGKAVYGPEDQIPIGRVFHGVAREWGETPVAWANEFGCDPKKIGADAWVDKQKHFGVIEQYDVGFKKLEGGKEDRTLPIRKRRGADGKFVNNWGGFPIKCYKVPVREALVQLLPKGPKTRVYGYGGLVPGPLLRLRLGQPVVVRYENHLETEISIHLHGGHSPSHSDGFPSFYVLQGKSRDYFYPNILPLDEVKAKKVDQDGIPYPVQQTKDNSLTPSRTEAQSTMWYHDHGMDATAYNVSKGLAGMALCFGEDELFLIRAGILPGLGEKSCFDPDEQKLSDDPKIEHPNHPGYYQHGQEPFYNPYDLPCVIQDKVIDANTGQIAYDGDAHNGYLGDSLLVNGQPWPVKTVENRKYRLRFLNGSNARINRLRLLSESDYLLSQQQGLSNEELEKRAIEFLRIGKDSWLWSEPLPKSSMVLGMANRADIIVDFATLYRKLGTRTFYLVNTMPQTDGRGPKAKLEEGGDPAVLPVPFDVPGRRLVELAKPVAIMKFVVQGEPIAPEKDAKVCIGMPLMPPRPRIEDDEVKAVREFIFHRGKGAWMINKRFYDPTISNASPILGSAEEWVLRNGGGGWWHPIHIHLESHQVIRYEKDFDADKIPEAPEPDAPRAFGNPQDITGSVPEFVGNEAAGFVIGNHDTQLLGPNTAVRIRMRFRTWPGPFVFHCHNLEHEDMRMMHNFEPVPGKDPEGKPHDPNVAPCARTHGNAVTFQGYDPKKPLRAVGELDWEYPPVPQTPVEEYGTNLIEPRKKPKN